MPEVYDCVMLFNELDMLETRLEILDPVVDHFVVCESAETHSGKGKPYHLSKQWGGFSPWHHKLIYIQVDDLNGANAWKREYFQRCQLAGGLFDAAPQDWVIVSDVDEIPRPEVVAQLRDSDLQAAKLELDMYYYDLNHRVQQGWAIGAYRKWIESDPNKIRTCAGYNPTTILNAGWHFSYIGGPDQIIAKVDAFMHFADPVIRDLPRDPVYIADRIAASQDLYGRDLVIERVPLSDSLPRYILDHLDDYREMGWVET